MRERLGVVCIVVVAGCAEPPPPPPAPVVAVTASSDRATGNIVPQFSADAVGPQLAIQALLTDRLDATRSIELATPERLVAVVNDQRVPLVGELYGLVGQGDPPVLWARYTATIAVPEPRAFTIEFDRRDGTTITSTLTVPAPYEASAMPSDIKSGDRVAFTVIPPPGVDTWGYWDATCDATPDQPIWASDPSVYVAADGMAVLHFDTQHASNNNCDAKLRIRLYGLGSYDARFGLNASAPEALRDVSVAVHLWGL